jgi:hypothetical protein
MEAAKGLPYSLRGTSAAGYEMYRQPSISTDIKHGERGQISSAPMSPLCVCIPPSLTIRGATPHIPGSTEMGVNVYIQFPRDSKPSSVV